jgi:putative hydrolase of the HAD superfamily
VPPFEIVFFDAGDTLLRAHPSFPELLASICRENGYDVNPGDVSAIQERLAPHLVELAHETGIDAPSLDPEDSRTYWSHLYRRVTGELGIQDEELVQTLYARFSHPSAYRLFDDALPCLTELKAAGYRLGLISNFEGWLEEMLVEMEVGHLFEVSVISAFEGIEKPDKALYERALSRAGVSADAAAHIGDSPKMDVEPASAVGMTTILLDRRGRYPDVPGPRVATLAEFPRLIAELEAP